MSMDETCEHLVAAKDSKVEPKTPEGCEECLKLGDSWVHLRECLTCGHVGCCDQSKNKHATAHFKETSHPVIKSLEETEHWHYCYVDELSEFI